MIRISLILFLTALSIIGFGQNVEIINKNDNPNKAINSDAFDYIEKGYDLKSENYIATMKGFVTNSRKSILPVLFNTFWLKANELGANSFYIEKVKKDRKSTRLNSSHTDISRMPSSA